VLPKRPNYLRQNGCMYVPAHLRQKIATARQRVPDSYPPKPIDCYSTATNKEELLIARQRFRSSVATDISTATIDRGGYKRKATESLKRVHDESPRQAVTVNNSRGRSTQARQRI
jgi:hypothetical protein